MDNRIKVIAVFPDNKVEVYRVTTIPKVREIVILGNDYYEITALMHDFSKDAIVVKLELKK